MSLVSTADLIAHVLGGHDVLLVLADTGWIACHCNQPGCDWADPTRETRFIRDDPRHLIEFRPDGWTIRHPLACRPNLFDCPVNRAAEADPPPPAILGRFAVETNDLGDRLLIGDQVEAAT